MKSLPPPILLDFFYFMEVWKSIKGFENYYEVSNLGNVKRKEGTSHLKPKNLKHLLDKDGYRRVNLKVSQKTNSKIVHRLIAEAFIDNPENKPQVNHINGIKGDNTLSNLEWCTLSENRRHAYSTGLQNGLTRRGVKNNFSKLTENQVRSIRMEYTGDARGKSKEQLKEMVTTEDLAKKYNVSRAAISFILNGTSWSWLK